MIYRSGNLSHLSESDIATLDSLGIKTVINFLTPEEIQSAGQDKLPQQTSTVGLPISGDNNEAIALIDARKNGDFSVVPVDFNYQVHAMLIEQGKTEYADMFNILLDESNYPVVIHCSHGIHRTGTASALILASMGVDWSVIQSDYLISNDTRKAVSDKRIQELAELAASNDNVKNKEENLKNIEAFYRLSPRYIDASKIVIEENYNGFDQYFESLGITPNDVVTLRTILIE